MSAKVGRRDAEKERYWQEKIRAAARSGLSIRELSERGPVSLLAPGAVMAEQEGKKKRVKKTIYFLTFND